jgi:hypothetical protein
MSNSKVEFPVLIDCAFTLVKPALLNSFSMSSAERKAVCDSLLFKLKAIFPRTWEDFIAILCSNG